MQCGHRKSIQTMNSLCLCSKIRLLERDRGVKTCSLLGTTFIFHTFFFYCSCPTLFNFLLCLRAPLTALQFATFRSFALLSSSLDATQTNFYRRFPMQNGTAGFACTTLAATPSTSGAFGSSPGECTSTSQDGWSVSADILEASAIQSTTSHSTTRKRFSGGKLKPSVN